MTGQDELAGRVPRRVVLFGEILFDEFPDGPVLGGAPLNVARHLLGLGIEPLVISRVGDDELGALALQIMTDLGLETGGVQRDPVCSTALAKVVLRGTGHYFELPSVAAFDRIDMKEARSAASDFRPDAVYWGTLAQRSGFKSASIRDFLDSVEAIRVLDLNLRAPWYGVEAIATSIACADVVKLNRDELEIVSLLFGVGGSPAESQVRHVIARNSLDLLVTTDGPYGVAMTRADGNEETAQGGPVDGVVDTVGAGDAIAAVIIAGRLLGWPDADTCVRADELARAICRVRGAAPATSEFYGSFLRGWNSAATTH